MGHIIIIGDQSGLTLESSWLLNEQLAVLSYYSCRLRPFQKIIEDVEEMLNNLPGVTSVHGRFYDLSSKYYRIIGNHAAYYKDALRYLGCVEIRDLPGGPKGMMGKDPVRWAGADERMLLGSQRRRSRRGPSRWGWPGSWEKEFTTLENWWDFHSTLVSLRSIFEPGHTPSLKPSPAGQKSF